MPGPPCKNRSTGLFLSKVLMIRYCSTPPKVTFWIIDDGSLKFEILLITFSFCKSNGELDG